MSSAQPPQGASTTLDNVKAGVKRWALAAVAAVVAESATFPIDFTKTRLQLQNELGRTLKGEVATTRLGMVATFRQILANEGLAAMYAGLPASALRQAVYGGIGVGLYAPVRQLIIGDQDPKDAPLSLRMLAGEARAQMQCACTATPHAPRPLRRRDYRGCGPGDRVADGRREGPAAGGWAASRAGADTTVQG